MKNHSHIAYIMMRAHAYVPALFARHARARCASAEIYRLCRGGFCLCCVVISIMQFYHALATGMLHQRATHNNANNNGTTRELYIITLDIMEHIHTYVMIRWRCRAFMQSAPCTCFGNFSPITCVPQTSRQHENTQSCAYIKYVCTL